MSRTHEFYRGFHEERTEPDPPDIAEPVTLRDSDDTPQDWR